MKGSFERFKPYNFFLVAMMMRNCRVVLGIRISDTYMQILGNAILLMIEPLSTWNTRGLPV